MGNLFSSDDAPTKPQTGPLTTDERASIERAVHHINRYREDIEQLAQRTRDFLQAPPQDAKTGLAPNQARKVTNIDIRYTELEGEQSAFLTMMMDVFTSCARADPQNKDHPCSDLDSSAHRFRQSADSTSYLIYLAANMKWMSELAVREGVPMDRLDANVVAAERREKEKIPPWSNH